MEKQQRNGTRYFAAAFVPARKQKLGYQTKNGYDKIKITVKVEV